MNMIEKFMNQVELTINELFNQKPKNDPISMLNLYVKQADKETETVKGLIERQAMLLKKVREDIQQVTLKLQERNTQLQLATSANEPQLIEFAQKEVTALEKRLQLLTETEMSISNEYIELEQQYELMKHEVESMKIRQMQLMGKENSKAAMEKMQQVGIKSTESYNLNKEMQQDHIVEQSMDDATLEQRLKALQSK